MVGCSKISPACDHCYAERMAFRLAHNPKAPIAYRVVTDAGTWNGQTALVESVLATPLRWRKPCRVFVGSMTDLFHPTVPDEWLDRVFAVMALTPHITYQVLTKRPERMRRYMEGCQRGASDIGGEFPWPNLWLGVTAENQARAEERIPVLLDTPAAVRFVSVEPMLGAVDLREYIKGERWFTSDSPMYRWLDWVICGGESGPGARPMHPEWARGLRDQCQEAGVPFFFKQWGEWGGLPYRLMAEKCVAVTLDGQTYSPDAAAFNGESLPDGAVIRCRVGKKAAGRLLDGREWNEFPGVRV